MKLALDRYKINDIEYVPPNSSASLHSLISIEIQTNELVFSELSLLNILQVSNMRRSIGDDYLSFIIPLWLDVPAGVYDRIKIDGFPDGDIKSWLTMLWDIEQTYNKLKKLKWTLDKLILILPYDIMVNVIFTGNCEQWHRLFENTIMIQTNNMLSDQTRQLLYSILFDLRNIIPFVFNDLEI